jgi:hypothetical protein
LNESICLKTALCSRRTAFFGRGQDFFYTF